MFLSKIDSLKKGAIVRYFEEMEEGFYGFSFTIA